MEKKRQAGWFRALLFAVVGAAGSIFAVADALQIKVARSSLFLKMFRYGKEWESLREGSRNLLAEAVRRIEEYYGIAVRAGSLAGAGSVYREAGLIAAGAFVFLALFFAFRIRKMRGVGYVVLIASFLAPFAVGTSLRADAMLLLGIAAVGLYDSGSAYRRSETTICWRRDMAVGLLLLAAFGIGHLWLREPITDYAESPETFADDAEAFFERARQARGGVGSGKVGEFDELIPGEETELILTAAAKPEESLYLRGFTGGRYEENEWEKKKLSSLERKTNRTGEELLGLPFEHLEEADKPQTLTVELIGANKAYRYEPYFSSYRGVSAYGDSFAKGGEKQYETEYCTASPGDIYAREGMEAYDRLVHSNYLEVPDSLRRGLRSAVEATAGTSEAEVCDKIRDYLAEETTYTLKPGRTPEGKDSILYFLQENKKGYCVHYAASAALLLRLQGIPSRFVSGYLVSPWLFHSSANGYEAVVTGGEAHAWAEYYLDGFGWVPFEATPGFVSRTTGIAGGVMEEMISDGAISEDGTFENGISDDETSDNGTFDGEEDNKKEEEQQIENETGGENESASGDQADEPENATGGEDEPGGQGDANGGASAPAKTWVRAKLETGVKLAGGMVSVLIAVLAVLAGKRAWCMRKKHLAGENRNTRAQYLYETCFSLLEDLGLSGEKLSECGTFSEEVSSAFSDISKVQAQLFYEIAEKAAFGGREITEKEELYLKKIYRKIWRKGCARAGILKKFYMKLWKNYDLVEK